MCRDGRPSPEIEAIERGNQPLVSTHWCFAVLVLELKHAIVAFEVLGGVKALARLAERDELIARADEAVKIAEQPQAPCENDGRKKLPRPRRAFGLHGDDAAVAQTGEEEEKSERSSSSAPTLHFPAASAWPVDGRFMAG